MSWVASAQGRRRRLVRMSSMVRCWSRWYGLLDLVNPECPVFLNSCNSNGNRVIHGIGNDRSKFAVQSTKSRHIKAILASQDAGRLAAYVSTPIP
jgi:hypothetical protein